MPDRAAHGFVVANQAWQYREARGVRWRPSVRPPCIRREIEDRARPGFPALRASIPVRGEQLEQQPAIAIDDEQMAIAARPATRHATLDVVRLRRRCGWNRIAGLTAESVVALAAV